MRMERIREIADAVLYEGYLLYPYRHSAIKNRQRWTFGVVYPRAYSEAHGDTEPWTMRTECLVSGNTESTLDVTVRFLHLLTRSAAPTGAPSGAPSGAQAVPEEPGQRGAVGWAPDTWEEGMEREVTAASLRVADLLDRPQRVAIAFDGGRLVEPSDDSPDVVIVREQRPLTGALTVAAEPAEPVEPDGTAYTLKVRIENTTPLAGELPDRHDAALLSSFVSTHTILQVRGGAFVSLLDPPEALRAAASRCKNERTYPVLVGDEEGDRDAMLSSPIILYDYPQIAPESAGALFDGTEIDEILTLRILALTDEEKAEMREGDERTRHILERTESLSAEQLMKLHGVIRSLRPSDERGDT